MSTAITGSTGTLTGNLTTPDNGELGDAAALRTNVFQHLINNDAELESRILSKADSADLDNISSEFTNISSSFQAISTEFTDVTSSLGSISSEFTNISGTLGPIDSLLSGSTDGYILTEVSSSRQWTNRLRLKSSGSLILDEQQVAFHDFGSTALISPDKHVQGFQINQTTAFQFDGSPDGFQSFTIILSGSSTQTISFASDADGNGGKFKASGGTTPTFEGGVDVWSIRAMRFDSFWEYFVSPIIDFQNI